MLHRFVFSALLAAGCCAEPLGAVTPGGERDPVRYTGEATVTRDRHDGALPLVVGTHNFQVFRANRTDLTAGNGKGWTYNHAPNLAYWQNRFYLEFVALPVNENEYPVNGKANRLLTWSTDGKTWATPVEAFPHVPVGGLPGLSGALSIQVSRGCFYTATNGRLLSTTSLGTNSNKAVGRLVREVYNTVPATFGQVYFIRYYAHSGYHVGNTASTGIAAYSTSVDQGFKAACDELLSRSLVTENWWEDELNAQHTDASTRPSDGFYQVPYTQGDVAGNFTKAMWTFQRADGNWVAGWKYGAFAIFNPSANTWTPARLASSIVTAAAKSWGQRTPDSRYALIYNPTSDNYRRWPLSMVTSSDGITFDALGTIVGDVPPMRYKGVSKEFGPQYARGIEPWNGQPESSAFWVAHSINKEDLWISRVPAPSATRVAAAVTENFETAAEGGVILPSWNLYSPIWAPVDAVTFGGSKRLRLQDRDPSDYAKAVRVFPESGVVTVSLEVRPAQTNGQLDIDVLTPNGFRPIRLSFGADGNFRANQGATMQTLGAYTSGAWTTVTISADCAAGTYNVSAGGLAGAGRAFAEPAVSLGRLELRTGEFRTTPVASTAPYTTADLPGADAPIANSVFYIDHVTTAADTTGPRVVETFGDGKNRITLVFDEPLGASATAAANYAVQPALPVVSAVLEADGKRVVLTLGSDLSVGTTYSVGITDVRDLAGNLVPANTTPTFTVPNAPPTANLRLWLRSDAGVTADANGYVSTWADQSSAGNTLTNTVTGTASKPRRIDGVLNGKPVLRFDGSDFLSRTVSGLIADKAGVFVVLKANRPASGQFIFDTATDGQLSRHQFVQNAHWLDFRVDANGGGINNDAFTDGSFIVAAYVMAGSSSFSRINAAGVRVGAFSDLGLAGGYTQIPAASGSPFVLGARYSRDAGFYNGEIAEVLIYNVAPTAAEVRQVEAYLMQKYFAQPGAPAQAATPLFSPPAGTYGAAQSVSLSSATGAASIRYTTDGSEPTPTHGTLYSTPVTVNATSTLKAIAYHAEVADSPVAVAIYTIQTGGSSTTVLADSFTDGDRTDGADLFDAQWSLLANSTPSTASAASGALVIGTNSGNAAGTNPHAVTTFPSQTLAVGDSITLSFDFNSTGSAQATGLRFGLYHSGGTSLTGDRYANPPATGATFQNDLGYSVFAPHQGASGQNITLYSRPANTTNHTSQVAAAANSVAIASAPLGVPTDTTAFYNASLRLTRTTQGYDYCFSYAGTSLSGSTAIVNTSSFDTLSIFGIEANNHYLTIDNVFVTMTRAAPPENLQSWRATCGLPADGSQDLANPSGDGIANLLKFALNLAASAPELARPNYRTVADPAAITVHTLTGLPILTRDAEARPVFSYLRRKSSNLPGIAYLVEWSDELFAWSVNPDAVESTLSIDPTWERVAVTDSFTPTAKPVRFARLGVVKSPPAATLREP